MPNQHTKKAQKPSRKTPDEMFKDEIRRSFITLNQRLAGVESKLRDDGAWRTFVESLVADHNFHHPALKLPEEVPPTAARRAKRGCGRSRH